LSETKDTSNQPKSQLLKKKLFDDENVCPANNALVHGYKAIMLLIGIQHDQAYDGQETQTVQLLIDQQLSVCRGIEQLRLGGLKHISAVTSGMLARVEVERRLPKADVQ
jgi:hypothetical protein